MVIKKKMYSKNAQTATEYLIILAVVIVIAVIVIGILGGIPGIGTSTGISADSAEHKLATIGVINHKYDATTTTFYVVNNYFRSIRLDDSLLENRACVIGTATLGIGEETTIACPNDLPGKVDLVITWTDLKTDGTLDIEYNIYVAYDGIAPITYLGGSGTEMDPYLVTSCTNIHGITDMSAYYEVTQNIDCSASTGWTYLTTQQGLRPIGALEDGFVDFTGSFDGGGFTISNMYMNSTEDEHLAFIGNLNDGGSIFDLRFDSATIDLRGLYKAAVVVGRMQNATTMTNVHVLNSYVNSPDSVGGLIGQTYTTGTPPNITNTSVQNTTVIANSGSSAGGLIGIVGSGETRIVNSFVLGGSVYASGNHVGGVVGLVQRWAGSGLIFFNNTYSTANVSAGTDRAGGLIGTIAFTEVYNSYATGLVNAAGSYEGGIVGFCSNTWVLNGSYYDNQTTNMTSYYGTGCAAESYTTGQTTASLQLAATFTNFDFTDTWGITDSVCYPYQKHEHGSCP